MNNNPKKASEYARYLDELVGQKRAFDENTDFNQVFLGYLAELSNLEIPENRVVLEKVFEPVPNGEKYLKRVIEVIEARGKARHTLDKQSIENLGQRHLENVTKLVGRTENKSLNEALLRVKDISILNEVKNMNFLDSDLDTHIYDTLCDWITDYRKWTFHIGVLNESFYILSSNHNYIKYYVLYPTYQYKLDFDLFEPYFKLFSNGYECHIENDVLTISYR